MKATIDGITYEGTEEEIRRIVENPPHRPAVEIRGWPNGDYPKNWDGSPRVTCGTTTAERRDDISCQFRSDHPTGGAE